MSIEMELDPPPRASMTEDDLHRMMELNRIIKLSESITSGKHPRIKIPPHLVPSTTSTASPKLPPGAERRPGSSKHAHDTLTIPTAETGAGRMNGAGHEAHSIIAGNNLVAFVQNSRSLDVTDATAPLSGLDFASGVRAVSPSNISLSEIPLQRARLEALLREPPNLRGKAKVEEVQADFLVDDVLRRGRELEKTFTPPPVAVLSQGLITNLGGASVIPKANASSSAAAESVDDQTFYSSNFSTPEFALTSRVPAESDRDDMPMEEGSDYEPELDYVPSSPQPAQQPDLAALQQVPPEQLATATSELSGQLPAELLSTLLGANFDSVSLTQAAPPQPSMNPTPEQIQQAAVAALSAWPGLLGGPQAASGGSGISSSPAHLRVAAGNPQPSSPFVRTHDLSPVAPQPAHISSLAVASQLPLAAAGGQSGSQGTLAQVAMLRRGEASQSSPDSSPYVDGRATDKGKGKKKYAGKRKADVNTTSPRIKLEPKSPSPILAPPAQRPHKRQKQDSRPPARDVVYRRQGDEYSPTAQPTSYGPPHAVRGDPRVPIIYERVDRGHYVQPRAAAATRRASLQRYEEQRSLEGGYGQAHTGYAPTIAAGPPSRQYAAGPSHPNVRPAGPATHTLVEKSSGYPVHSAGEYEGSGRANMRPVAMAPPPRERVVVDEFDREYYEPVPPPRPQQPVMESVTYDPNLAYERPASRLHQQLRYEDRYGSQAPQPVYDDDEIVYRRTSPMFAAPRRVVTQPEYVTREYADYPRREFSARPPPSQYPVAAERGYIVEGAAPVPGYVTRASTVRPPEAARYEAPPPGRYVERVGSVRPPDAAVYQGYAGGPEDGPRIYGGPARGVPEGGAYIDDRRGPHEVVREYSIRPESHVVVHREYSARPGPASAYYAEQAPYAMGGPPTQEYAYSDERAAYQ